MKILTTCGAGFLGSAVALHIIENTDDEVVFIDSVTFAENLENLVSVVKDKRFVFDQIDICDSVSLDQKFMKHKLHAVMNLAAKSHVDRSIAELKEFIRTNTLGTFNFALKLLLIKEQLQRVSFKETDSWEKFSVLARESVGAVYGRMHTLILCYNLGLEARAYRILQKIEAFESNYLSADNSVFKANLDSVRNQIL